MNNKLITIALTSLALVAGACSGEKGWTVDGVVDGGEGRKLALEGFNNSRWYVIDSISVASNETFAYHSAKPAPYPEILRLTLDGNSIYFLRFDGESAFSVRMSAAEVAYAPLLNVGDRVCVYYRDGYVTENWIEASDVELLDGSAQSAPPVETSVSTEDSADPVENAQEMP